MKLGIEEESDRHVYCEVAGAELSSAHCKSRHAENGGTQSRFHGGRWIRNRVRVGGSETGPISSMNRSCFLTVADGNGNSRFNNNINLHLHLYNNNNNKIKYNV